MSVRRRRWTFGWGPSCILPGQTRDFSQKMGPPFECHKMLVTQEEGGMIIEDFLVDGVSQFPPGGERPLAKYFTPTRFPDNGRKMDLCRDEIIVRVTNPSDKPGMFNATLCGDLIIKVDY